MFDSAAMKACKQGQLDIVKEQLSQHPNLLNEKSSFLERSALHCAVIHNHPHIVRFLMEMKADYNLQDKHRKTALHYAVERERTEIVQLFIAFQVNWNVNDGDLSTPLHYAAKVGNEEIYKLLLNAGADQNALDNLNNSPSVYQVRHCCLEVKITVNYAANVFWRAAVRGPESLQ